MPLYMYRAVTKNGQIVSNKVEAFNKHMLLKKLKDNGLLPIEVKPPAYVKSSKKVTKQKRNAETSNSVLKEMRIKQIEKQRMGTKESVLKRNIQIGAQKITKRDIMVFTQNFYLLKKANFNNVHALSTIIETTENSSLRTILEDILLGVEAGDYMYVTMEYYEGVFPPIYISTIKVGELSGSLTNSLEQAIRYLDETAAMSKKLRSILIPNLIQFFGIFILLILGTVLGVPLIQSVFDKVGSTDQLPAITLWFSNFLDLVAKFWYVPTSIILGVIVFIFIYVRTPRGQYTYHTVKYKLPVFGKLIYLIDFSRFTQAVLLNIRNGQRIQDALETSKNVVKNMVMLSIIESSINNILIGRSWIESFENSGFSSHMTTEMLKIGMQTDLQDMMEKLLEYIQIDIDNTIQRIMKVLPQIVYSIVGVMLIFLTLVVLVPMIQVYMGSWMFSAYGF